MNLQMDLTSILVGAFGMIGLILPAYLKFRTELLTYKREDFKNKKLLNEKNNENTKLKKQQKEDKIKLDFFNRIMDVESINKIKNAVQEIFEKTKADRFLILIAVNGKTEFNVVNVIFEQHDKGLQTVNAIATYRNVNIDREYRNMLKLSEVNTVVELETAKMEDCLLRDFYEMEGVTFSKIRFLARRPIDDENDFLVYSSLATHDKSEFTKKGKSFIQLKYDSVIKPAINKVLE